MMYDNPNTTSVLANAAGRHDGRASLPTRCPQLSPSCLHERSCCCISKLCVVVGTPGLDLWAFRLLTAQPETLGKLTIIYKTG